MATVDTYLYSPSDRDIRIASANWAQVLDVSEQQRVQRFRHALSRDVFLCSRFLLRTLLAQRLGCPPGEVELALDTRGKPFLVGGEVEFNISHSGRWIVIAVSDSQPVGVDIERCRALEDLPALAQRVLSENELRHFAALNEEAKRQVFFRSWVLKEACTKLWGAGLWQTLAQLEVQPSPPVLLRAPAAASVRYLAAPEPFLVALATAEPAHVTQHFVASWIS